MADIEIADGRGATLVPGAHRAIRTVDTSEGPFAGTLVTQGDGVAVRVDAADLSGWVGWRFAGAEHVAAPIDVGRRSGGHDALLPWCTDRVLGFLGRRTAAGGNVAPGECSTVVVSLLRGVDELGEGAEGVRTGAWWLTDGGRPVFVLGDGPDARVGVVEIVQYLGEHSTDKVLRRALAAIEEGLGKTLAQPRLPRKLTETWEQELLSIAAPQPLVRGSHAAERAGGTARAVVSHDLVVPSGGQRQRLRLRADRSRTGESRRAVGWVGIVGDTVRAFLGEIHARFEAGRVIRQTRGTPRRRATEKAEPRGHRRRRSLLVAGAAAAIVLAGGLLWPNGDASGEATNAGGAASERPPWTQDEATAPGVPETSDGPDEEDSTRSGSAADEDAVAASTALLATIAECRAQGDASCPDGISEGSEGVMEALSAVEPGLSTAELVDAYGDVAVIRLLKDDPEESVDETSSQAPAQMMVVLTRTEEKWLVRDVYDVADQPG